MILKIIVCVINLLCVFASFYVLYDMQKSKKPTGWIKQEGDNGQEL